MRLYDYGSAPSPRRVRIFAAEKEIELERVPVDLATGEQMSDSFRQLNPECTVPVLELDDGTCISEVLAICDYLEQIRAKPALMGSDAKSRAEVLMWNARIEQNLLTATMDLFRNSTKGLESRALTGPVDFDQIPELVERSRARATLFSQRLDLHMDGRQFILGRKLSLVDITALVAVDFARWAKLDLLENAPNLKRWHNQMSARASAQAQSA